MKSNPVIKIEYSGKEPASSRANYKKLDRIVDPGFPVDPMGYWNPANIGQIVQVPTEDGNISMEGVNQDLIGMDEYGNTQYQEPGKKYKYRGKFITEYPIAKDGGWLDKYQSKGEVKKDKRKIPQSGMVIDKRTNQAYYFGDKGETGSFPVLTGLNPELNSNTYTPQTLNQNPQLKNTPVGYYMMEQGLPKTPYTNTYYNGRVRPMQPIPAFGMNAPDSEDLSIHNTFSDPNNPSIFNSRNKMYSAPGDKRYVSQGCINCQKESYDAFNKAIPHDDTLMVLDSKKPMDFVLLQQAQARMKKKQYGGWLDTMQDGGATSLRAVPTYVSEKEQNKYTPYQRMVLQARANNQADREYNTVTGFVNLASHVPGPSQLPLAGLSSAVDFTEDNYAKSLLGLIPYKPFKIADAAGDVKDMYEQKKGGSVKGLSKFTSKNIKTSVNKLQNGGTKPWGEMTPKERAAYLDAKDANKKAETKSRAQAKKEHINDYIINSTKEALTHPLFSAPAYFTPQGAMIGAGQAAINASKNIYEGNYKMAAFDALGTLPLLKQLKNIPKIIKPNIKGKFEGVGSADDIKQLSAKPTYENNPYIFRDPHTNQPIYQTDPADFQNFKNTEMINEAKTHYKKASNDWLNTEGIKRSGNTDVPQFNEELKYIKDQAQYGKKPLLDKNNIGTSKEYDIYRNDLEQWKKNTNQQEEGVFDFFNKNKEDLTDPEMLKIFPKPQPKNFYIKGDEKRAAFVRANELNNKEVPEAVKYFNNPDKEKVVQWMKTGDPKDVIREMNPRKYKNLDQMNNQQLEKARQEVYDDFINSWKNSLKDELSNTYTGKQAFTELTPNKYGGESDEEFRRGGQKGLKKFTSKNIATSVNDIMMRNETLFGKPGKKRYKPGLKFKNGGGWLDNIV